MRPLAVIQRYIGFNWNLESCTVALPLEKLSKTLLLLDQWLEPNRALLAHDAGVIPASLVILFAVSVTKVKCISRSKVLLQRQVKYITGSEKMK